MTLITPKDSAVDSPYLLVETNFEHFPIAAMQKHQVLCQTEEDAELRLNEMLHVRDMIAGRIECPDGFQRAWLTNWGPQIIRIKDSPEMKVTMRGCPVCLPLSFVANDEAMHGSDESMYAEKARIDAAIWRG